MFYRKGTQDGKGVACFIGKVRKMGKALHKCIVAITNTKGKKIENLLFCTIYTNLILLPYCINENIIYNFMNIKR